MLHRKVIQKVDIKSKGHFQPNGKVFTLIKKTFNKEYFWDLTIWYKKCVFIVENSKNIGKQK